MERRAPGATGPGLRSGLRPKFSKPNPIQTKPDQENGLGFSWIPSSDSGLFNGLQAVQTIQIKKSQLPRWRWSSAAVGQRASGPSPEAMGAESVHDRGGGAISGREWSLSRDFRRHFRATRMRTVARRSLPGRPASQRVERERPRPGRRRCRLKIRAVVVSRPGRPRQDLRGLTATECCQCIQRHGSAISPTPSPRRAGPSPRRGIDRQHRAHNTVLHVRPEIVLVVFPLDSSREATWACMFVGSMGVLSYDVIRGLGRTRRPRSLHIRDICTCHRNPPSSRTSTYEPRAPLTAPYSKSSSPATGSNAQKGF